jgi:imidazolonepropionase-like amidohydrolase
MVLVGGRVYDGDQTLPDTAVWIDGDGIIRGVGGSDEILAAAREADPTIGVVDLAGAVVTPGLVNMHVHLGLGLPGPLEDAVSAANPAELVLLMADSARRTLHAGVTTVRLVGETQYADFALRKAIDLGAVDGPHIYTAGHALCCTGGHGHGSDGLEADGADGFRRATREQIRAGADLIKVCVSGGIAGEHEEIHTPQLTDDEMEAVISTAHDWGRKVTAHAGPSDTISRAVALGLDCVEHGYQMSKELTDQMAANGVWYVPTITVSRCKDFFEANRVPAWMIDRALSAGPAHWQSLQNAIASGVTIAMGSDMPPFAPYDGTSATVREMEFMAEAGMTALDVMRSATERPAQWLESEAFGRIAVGCRADLTVMAEDPTVDISALRGIDAVLKAGVLHRDDLSRFAGVVAR